MQILKAGLNVMEDTIPLADTVEKPHELAVPVAGQLIDTRISDGISASGPGSACPAPDFA